MGIAVASDHGGFRLKSDVVRLLGELGHDCRDFGIQELHEVDYPDYTLIVAGAAASGEYQRGIHICATGQGMSITANKITGIRAAICHDTFSARLSREHNDAKMLCLGERGIGSGLAADTVETWLQAKFSGGERHSHRVNKIVVLEEA